MKRRVFATAGIGCAIGALLAIVFRPSLYPTYVEGIAYLLIAKLDFRGIPVYYAGRVLHPLVVRLVAHAFHVPIDARPFLWVSAASLIVLFACLGAYYGLEFPSTPGLWLLLAVTATLVDQYRNYYWHDLFYTALCALFFLALRANWWLALPIIFLLYVTRESTIVLVVALVAITAFRRQWAFCLSALAVGLAGMGVEAVLLRHALPNSAGISMVLLDVLKIPYNFALNICGLEFWTNTNATTIQAPKWIASLPTWLHLGKIHQVGFSGFFWELPARTFLLLLTSFGVLPLIAIRTARRGWGRLLPRRFDLATACVYGTLMFVLAPLQGTAPARYILYAWPLFWLFGVAEMEAAIPERRRRIAIVALSACAAWIPAVVRLVMTRSLPQGPESLSDVSDKGLLISLALVAVIYVCGWRLAGPTKPIVE
ncbi:MAG TPA: hypothetical protein VHX49_08515 [Candidatus Acidoferrales bacterium]|nr:hypothetical protein [Candidatus Acidoferrales bacterium]